MSPSGLGTGTRKEDVIVEPSTPSANTSAFNNTSLSHSLRAKTWIVDDICRVFNDSLNLSNISRMDAVLDMHYSLVKVYDPILGEENFAPLAQASRSLMKLAYDFGAEIHTKEYLRSRDNLARNYQTLLEDLMLQLPLESRQALQDFNQFSEVLAAWSFNNMHNVHFPGKWHSEQIPAKTDSLLKERCNLSVRATPFLLIGTYMQKAGAEVEVLTHPDSWKPWQSSLLIVCDQSGDILDPTIPHPEKQIEDGLEQFRLRLINSASE